MIGVPAAVRLTGRALERISLLRERALAMQHSLSPFTHEVERQVLLAEGLQATEGESRLLGFAERIYHILDGMTPVIGEGELIVGLPLFTDGSEEDRLAMATAQETIARLHPKAGGMTGHMTIDEESLLRLGVRGILQRIDELDAAHHEFYAACRRALGGILTAAEHYRTHALCLAEASADPVVAGEYRAGAETLAQVPVHPARTFREALQSHYFVLYCLHMESFGQLYGRVDRWAYPYYLADITAGRLTDEEALELLSAYYSKINELHGTWPTAVLVGGQDTDGNDVTNALSYLCLDALDATCLVNPSLAISCHPGTPDALLRRGCELLLKGHARPAFFNDTVIVPGMEAAGCTRAEAVNYVHSSCVEITPGGCSNVWVASPYLDLLLPLEWIFNEGRSFLPTNPETGLDLGPLERYASFDSLLAAYQRQLAAYINKEANGQVSVRRERWENNAYPLLSCFVRDCLERGMDIDRGGARHNWVMPSHVGLANTIDSLAIIRELVYTRRSHMLAELRDLLLHPDRQEERRQIARSIIPYGNDCAQTDELAKALTDFIADTYTQVKEPVLDSSFHPGYFCWVMHEHWGRQTGASLDGREAGEVLADGSGAAQGRDRRGPTTAINSVTGWNHTPCLGGIAMNLKFTAHSLRGPEGAEALLALVKSYLAQGGFEIQINVVSAETLRDAQTNPTHHRDLVVRVAGFSEYFVLLSPAMQNEVIARTAHEC
ncbi:MAG: pyruvate formate lyase family protein [Armatimonadota bacterium]